MQPVDGDEEQTPRLDAAAWGGDDIADRARAGGLGEGRVIDLVLQPDGLQDLLGLSQRLTPQVGDDDAIAMLGIEVEPEGEDEDKEQA